MSDGDGGDWNKWRLRQVAGVECLFVPLQLSLAPMRLFAIGIDSLHAVVHSPQHPDSRVKQWGSTFRSHDQCLYGGLPVWQLLLSLRQLLDVLGGVT